MRFIIPALILGLGLFANAANACTFRTVASDRLKEVVTQHGGWPVSDELCAFLNSRKLSLMSDEKTTVLAGVSVGVVIVRLSDANNVVSDTVSNSIYINTGVASMDKADELTYLAVTDAIKGFNVEKAAAEVAKYAKAAKLR
jgi:hypothetical protein